MGREQKRFKRSKTYKKELVSFGRRVRSLRYERDWTLEKASEKMRLDLKHLQKIEAGQLNVTFVTLVRIADGLDVRIGELFE